MKFGSLFLSDTMNLSLFWVCLFMFPERETPRVPEGVEPIPEELPEHIERVEKGVSTRKASFAPKVTDDAGQVVTQSPTNTGVTIHLPTDKKTLEGWSKGSVTDSLTWLATFWLRAIKKAAHFGWKAVVGKKE